MNRCTVNKSLSIKLCYSISRAAGKAYRCMDILGPLGISIGPLMGNMGGNNQERRREVKILKIK
jgi:hypothetical protein